jgi:hypothetical protein
MALLHGMRMGQGCMQQQAHSYVKVSGEVDSSALAQAAARSSFG